MSFLKRFAKQEPKTEPEAVPTTPEPARRVHFAEPAARVPKTKAPPPTNDDDDNDAPASSKKNVKKSTGVSKRPRDVFIEDAALTSDLLHKPVEPAERVLRPEDEQSESVSANNTFPMEAYSVMTRYLVETVMSAANFEQDGSDRAAQNVKAALVHAQQRQLGVGPSSYLNHMIRIVDSERARTVNADGVQILDTTPYSDSTQSAFASNFIAGAIECSPDVNAHEHVPSNEMRAASQPLPREYIESFLVSAAPGEYECAAGEDCRGMHLYDEHGNKLPGTRLRAFWFPAVRDDVYENPAKYAQEAKYTYCILCKIYKANKCMINAASRNNRVSSDVLAADFHVFVDIRRQFPITSTRGRLNNGNYGTVQNIPHYSCRGWTAVPDSRRANCWEYKWNIPYYPIERAWFERDVGQGF